MNVYMYLNDFDLFTKDVFQIKIIVGKGQNKEGGFLNWNSDKFYRIKLFKTETSNEAECST